MLTVISCRESNASSSEFGPHVIPGDLACFDGGPLGRPILIHGYNRTETQATQDFIPFSAALGADCIAYSWPGGCHPLDFPSAVTRAGLAGLRLRDVFSMRRLRSGSENIITHSLGARVVLAALKGSEFRIDNLILMGAAVDWNVFGSGGEFESVPQLCNFVHVLYSNRDEVLKLAFPLGDFGGDCHALGLDGPSDPLAIAHNVVLHDVSDFIDAHAAYVTHPECSDLVRQILRA